MRRFSVPILLFIAVAAASVGIPSARGKQTGLTVSAAISLKDALDAITPLFAKANPGIAVHYNLGASGTLQQQIQQGAPVDVYISASSDQMDALAKQGLLIQGTRQDMVRNTVVLVAPTKSSGIASFNDLKSSSVKVIAVGEPKTVPAGKYAQEVLTHFGLYDPLHSKFVFAKDVRQVLTYVASGDADAGIVYATDAKTTAKVKVVATAPEDSHSPVVYPAAVLKDSKNVAAAQAFVSFLRSPTGQAVFEKFGFSHPLNSL